MTTLHGEVSRLGIPETIKPRTVDKGEIVTKREASCRQHDIGNCEIVNHSPGLEVDVGAEQGIGVLALPGDHMPAARVHRHRRGRLFAGSARRGDRSYFSAVVVTGHSQPHRPRRLYSPRKENRNRRITIYTRFMSKAPELLAPAGDHDCLRAAIANGADAIYFGLETGFNARARATNFTVDDLPAVMQLLHRHGLRGYVTLNTLVFTDELDGFAETVAAVAAAGVDAVLLQDVGAARLVREICPELPLHASTQMTLTSAETIRLAEALGIERVVLARELSLEEIRAIAGATTMPLEVFVHGALCVAYSGQCLTSESLGGRSANRGQCAQACRLPYDLLCDGAEVDLRDQKYLLSPQDLAGFALVPELLAAGVASLKIEGRLKAPEYVAAITRRYREAIDTAVAGEPVVFSPRQIEEMELTFSRGFSPGWLEGCDHKLLVPATSSAKRGVLLGRVTAVSRQRVTVELTGCVKRGDGVAFAAAADEPQGGRVYELFRDGRPVSEAAAGDWVAMAFGTGAIDLTRLTIGSEVWKTDDPQLTRTLRKTFAGDRPRRQQPIDLLVTAAVGQPLLVEARLADGRCCQVAADIPAQPATRHPLDEATLCEQLGRLGGTPFALRKLTAEIMDNPMVPFSVLGTVRKRLVTELEQLVEAVPRRTVAVDPIAVVRQLQTPVPSANPQQNEVPHHTQLPTLHVLVRSLDQLQAAVAAGERDLIADFADIRQYREAVGLARQQAARLQLATPRIQKPGELGVFAALGRHEPDGVLVRNFSGLEYFRSRGIPVAGDFSFNVTNSLAAEFFLSQGLERLAVSYDCNREQLLQLVASCNASQLEVVIHQHMPMFHMEHCVFCSVLSPGTNKNNCGRPCDDHTVHLRDRIGVEHLLTADVGCRNTLFNAVAQSGAEAVGQLVASGIGHLRIELLEESAAETGRVIASYRDLLAGRVTGREVWAGLRAANRVGVTRGTLEERRNPLAII